MRLAQRASDQYGSTWILEIYMQGSKIRGFSYAIRGPFSFSSFLMYSLAHLSEHEGFPSFSNSLSQLMHLRIEDIIQIDFFDNPIQIRYIILKNDNRGFAMRQDDEDNFPLGNMCPTGIVRPKEFHFTVNQPIAGEAITASSSGNIM